MSRLGDKELGERIRTLTTILHKLNLQKPPSRRPKDILPFLSHFTTLLTCGDEDDRQAKKVIAVTGSIDTGNQVRALIVSQNPYLSSPVQDISLEVIKKDKRPLEEVVKRPPNAPLINHVADVWTALSALAEIPERPDYGEKVEAVELFFLSRSHRKLVTCFKEDKKLCGGRRLFEVIKEWQPDRPVITAEWVSLPDWLVDLKDNLSLPSIESRVVEGEVEWEFSDSTKKAWSKILEFLLTSVDYAIERVQAAVGSTNGTQEEVHKVTLALNTNCSALFYFVHWDAGIVKSLLTKTNMVASITSTFLPAGTNPTTSEIDDDGASFLQEPEESKGEQLYRYLKTVIAWHHAVSSFSRNVELPKVLEGIQIGLVEVPSSLTTVTPLEQICKELFARFPDMFENRDEVSRLLEDHHSKVFSGCCHAEATLIGLVNYYASEAKYTGRDAAVMDTQPMRDIIQPVASAWSAVIAVNTKCCWCCDWLSQQLETRFKLSGTHGLMYPWGPPTVGISGSVLQRLENALWNELHQVVLKRVLPSYSSQSSAPSSSEGTGKKHMRRLAIDHMTSG